ncbi:MAG: TIGR03915 family putative DNA repair protein [Mucilaginibacter sp.]|uniref:TIGR03915 family putative DNA repair protein n=1 Tax=Mucilaginibacter sp. TaxID=1882438 RepID=UPI0034E3E617
MITLIYDGTFEGLLTAVFEIYEHKLTEVSICPEHLLQPNFFDAKRSIVSDTVKANRVLKGLHQRLAAGGVQRLYAAHLSEIAGEEDNLLGFIRYAFSTNETIEQDFGNKYVMRLSYVLKLVRREKHRMEAFVRFQKMADGIFYASIEPDFNVLPLILQHFKRRYADQKWIIYDIKRAYGIYYDLQDAVFIQLNFASSKQDGKTLISSYSEDETLYQALWKDYFKHVNIPARKNTKLHLQHVPKRYWKHLTEKI